MRKQSPNSLANLKKFKKGQIANPEGARAHNKELREVRTLTHKEVGEIATMILQNDLTALTAIKTDKKASVLRVWFASVAVKAITAGDFTALSALLDRILGKVTERVHHTGTQTVMQQGTVLILPEKEIHGQDNPAARPTDKIPGNDG